MGGPTARDRRLLEAPLPDGERCFGLDNFGNTCYANSVLQGLYQCQPFRLRMLDLAPHPSEGRFGGGSGSGKLRDDTVPNTLAALFAEISGQKKRVGSVAPKRFIQKIKQEWEQFRSYDEHQDAHELLINLLNLIGEQLEADAQAATSDATSSAPGRVALQNGTHSLHSAGQQQQGGAPQQQHSPSTWLHELFEGREVHETQCLCCDTVTRREEPFIVLSLPVIQNSSISHCLGDLSAVTTLQGDEKFECNECGTYQEAHRRARLSHLPPVLLLHLKRFKTTTHLDRDGYMRMVKSKLLYRVVFPFTLKMGEVCSVEGPEGADAAYTLFAVIVHVGSGMDHGHYVAVVKSGEVWLLYEDDSVEAVPPSYVTSFFGGPHDFSNSAGHGYILMYQRLSNPQVAAAISTSLAKAHAAAKGH